MDFRESIYLALIIFLLVGSVSAAPDEPHRMFGEVTNSDGDVLETEVLIEHEDSEVKDFETESDGSYDVMIPKGDYENQELDILIEEETIDTIVFEPLGVTKKDLVYQKEKESQEEQRETGGGDGEGLLSDYEEESITEEEIIQNEESREKDNNEKKQESSDSSQTNKSSGNQESAISQNSTDAERQKNNSLQSLTGEFYQEQVNGTTVLLIIAIIGVAAFILREYNK